MATVTKEADLISFSKDPNYIELESENYTGADPGPYTPDEENLSGYIKIEKHTFAQGGGDNYTTLVERRSPFDDNTKKTYFNINEVFNLKPHLPLKTSIKATGVTYGQCSNNLCRYRLTYAESYGSPPVIQTETSQSLKYAIYGSTRYDQGFSTISTGDLFLLHAYQNEKGEIFQKEVRKEQPEYIYFFWHDAYPTNTIDLKVRLTYIDGVTEDFTIGAIGNPDRQNIYWVAAGYAQLDIDNIKSNEVKSYEVILYENGTPSPENSVRYLLDDECNPWDRYFLMFNGLGAVETVRFSGKSKYGQVRSSGQLHTRVKTIGHDFADGEIRRANVKTHKTIKANTGYHNEDFINHLRQLAAGEVYEIDMIRETFYAYLVTSSQVSPGEDDKTLFSMAVDMRPAWDDFSYNNYRI